MSGVFFLFKSPLNLMGLSGVGVKIDFQERMERVRALTDQLEAGITGLFQSGQYAAYLQSLSKLHHYSYGNIFLIKLQCPHASMVAGYGDWKRKFGRHVKAGETDITILAPCPYWARDEVEETGPDGQNHQGTEMGEKNWFHHGYCV